MFDNGDEKNVKESPKRASPLEWHRYTVPELIRFQNEISRYLPPMSLKDVNLEEEMLKQLHATSAMQSDISADSDVPANQKAQIASTMTTILTKLGDMQEALYTTERLKRIESLLIRHLKTLPEETAKSFLEGYEKILEELGGE